jgi:hypothetical protein
VIWLLLLAVAGGLVWFLVQPRRLQTIENIPAVVDKDLNAHSLVETTEDPREVRPIAQAAANRAGDVAVKGHGDSLTKDWPNDQSEPHGS